MSDQSPYTPSLDEREALGWREAEAYADDHEPSKRAETADDFMAGWRAADRFRRSEALAEFDRLIAQVRAETLREARALIAADGNFCPSLDARIEQGETDD